MNGDDNEGPKRPSYRDLIGRFRGWNMRPSARQGDDDHRQQALPREGRLQDFEFALIKAISDLGTQAFPAELTRRLSQSLKRNVALAQVFIALERLEYKGFVSSRVTDPEPVRGGRRRRVFQIEASGLQAIRITTAINGMPRSDQNEEVGTYEGAFGKGPKPAPT